MSEVGLNEALRQSYTLTLLRRAEVEAPLDRLAALCAASAALRPEARFELEVTESEVRPTRTTAEDFRRMGGPLVLATSADPPVTLTWHRDRLRSPAEDVVRIHVPMSARWAMPSVLWSWLGTAAVAFDAAVGGLATYDLLSLVGSSTWREIVAATPPDLRAFVPRPAGPTAELPDEVIAAFSALVPARTFDRTSVPEAVWWANVWSAPVVARVGKKRIETVPWRHVEASGDGMLLVSVEEPPDGDHPEALGAVARAIEALRLPELQLGTA